jgi:hypothetical protein
MSGELHLDPSGCAVHFYLNHNAPLEWDSRVRKFLTRESARQAAAKLLEPRSRREGTDVVRVPAITTSWLMRQEQDRQEFGASLRAMRTDAAKRRVLQTLAGACSTSGRYGHLERVTSVAPLQKRRLTSSACAWRSKERGFRRTIIWQAWCSRPSQQVARDGWYTGN